MRALDEDSSDIVLPYNSGNQPDSFNEQLKENRSLTQDFTQPTVNYTQYKSEYPSMPKQSQFNVSKFIDDEQLGNPYPRLTGIFLLVFRIIVLVSFVFQIIGYFMQFFFHKVYSEIVFIIIQLFILSFILIGQFQVNIVKQIIFQKVKFLTTELGIIIYFIINMMLYNYNFLSIVPVVASLLMIVSIISTISLLVLFLLVIILRK
ncbi:Transmembrane domain-containing protein [Spironucleus salmonicida]|uniref:Transmembrane domain-containing protein n=1 Tax=Spironucleus salmonicida TaxID=348837 RepID=A0A9P8LMY7_9EUKA|nr:Transmembrane domain-containing protein [Spironucleus salmonicida]